jgi:hypothetical protein
VVIDEAVLLRSIGSAQVMAGQLRYLRSCADLPSVTLQVASLAAAHPRICPSLTVLRFADAADCVVYKDDGGGRVSVIRHRAEADAIENTFAVLARTAMSPEDSAGLLGDLVDGSAVTCHRA